MTNAALRGKPDAGNPHVRFDEGEVAPCTEEVSLRRVHWRRQPEGRASVCAATPRRGSLLYNKLLGMICVVVAAASAYSSSITIDSVVQRWPWNNKFDITYTVTDGQMLTADGVGDVYCKIVFTATIGGQTYEIDGVTNVGANASSGQHTVTWTPPTSLRAKDMNCTMTATLMSAAAPSGDDYMIVDLDTGTVSFEGMLYSQELSNARYNVNEYKTEKMVLRKVPCWAKRDSLPNSSSLTGNGYPTGDNANYASSNSEATWETKRDYYAGVFMVTKAQYCKVFGRPYDASTDTIPAIEGNYWTANAGRYITWNALRDSQLPTNTVPAESDGGFFARLKFKTGDKYDFDMPTLIMSEIAARAGNRGRYYWGGDSIDESYLVYNASATAVGSKKANSWGLYDVAGNGFEHCLDDASLANIADASDAFTASWGGASQRRNRGGTTSSGTSIAECSASYYKGNGTGITTAAGFRVFVIIK